ncbi:hypothetical protein GOBAR_AA12983 [Gossypium barbadense]|uniref:E3 UFM1-protein ligase 1 homolog n=1 Tax=Gossypium barbadense TaxID=3634 RepID=A0A2P5XWD0_GOSBA|nr:hypothetical protein GOBAR_AA12983 [Gossypium barbadense]
MDDELLELQRQFEFAQQAKSSIRLSERNVVELVQKLHELRIIDFELLHTVSGKEYITPEQLRHEIAGEVKKLGRVSLIDLADTTGVDLYHVEKQAQHVVSEDPGLMLIQGEIISQSYWDSVAEEINERLQECSQIALAELAAQLYVGSELVASVLEPRLGTLVKGRLEGGQLYTPAYIARVSAMVRGASRGITVPTNLSVLWSSLQQLLQEMEGATGLAVEGSFFQSLFNGLVKEGEVLGTLRAGIHWTPTVFAIAQKECVDSFFSQNSFISYDTLHKLGISQPIQYLQPRFPEGIPLVTAFVHPSMIEMLDAAIEDAIERGSWLDSLSLLPTSFGAQDASKILSLSPSVQSALKANKALIVGDSYLFSSSFVKDVYDRVEKELETLSHSGSSTIILSDDSHMVKEAKAGKDLSKSSEPVETVTESGNKKRGTEKGSKKKKGKSSGARTVSAEGDSENEDYIPTKSKKNQKKGKDASSSQVADSRKVVKKDSIKAQEENVPSEEWLMQKLEALLPDFEEQGVDDPQAILKYLADYLRPMLANYLKERRKALFTENVEKMKILLDNLQRKLDEVTLHRHLLRTVATSIADMLFHNLDLHNKLKNGTQVEDSQNSESISLSPGERTAIAKSLPESQSKRALAVVEALEGKRMETFMPALRDLAEESGLFLKKLDKKLERTLLHSYRKACIPYLRIMAKVVRCKSFLLVYGEEEASRKLKKDLTSQVSAETDPVSLLPKVVSLLYIQVHSRALQAPGRAISVAVTRLKAILPEAQLNTK